MVELFANSGDPDQMLQKAASDLGLHCLPVTLLGVSSLQWVNCSLIVFIQFTLGSVQDLGDPHVHSHQQGRALDMSLIQT